MKSNYYSCQCKCGVLHLNYEPEWGLEIALFERNVSHPWWNRIRLAWSTLKGRPYTDMVILDNQQIADLVDQLTYLQNLEEYSINKD